MFKKFIQLDRQLIRIIMADLQTFRYDYDSPVQIENCNGYYCKYCGEHFERQNRAKQHSTKCLFGIPFRMSCIKEHIEYIHNIHKCYKCLFCKYASNVKANVKKHLTTTHSGKKSNLQVQEIELEHFCDGINSPVPPEPSASSSTSRNVCQTSNIKDADIVQSDLVENVPNNDTAQRHERKRHAIQRTSASKKSKLNVSKQMRKK